METTNITPKIELPNMNFNAPSNKVQEKNNQKELKDIEGISLNSLEKENVGYDENLDKMIKQINEKFKVANREFSYQIHEKTNRFIVAVKDTDTGKIIKEIPSEESLDLFAKILEMAGLLIDEKS